MAYLGTASNVLVEPAKYGGIGKNTGEPFGGLQGRVFDSKCPPIVTVDTIVIGVCGPNDYRNNASPESDGWFFSDFYLFHHMLQGTAKEQYWMTCVDPRQLIEKYKEFSHGDPRTNNRRVVLDETMRKDVEDVLVFQEKDLLERFLAYVADASKGVKGTNRPMLIMIFGHGTVLSYSITIGGTGKAEKCDILTIEKFQEALLRHNSNPNVTLMTTACYGGGWVQSPCLNITALAGVDEETQLLSWPVSDSMGRCCGSRYATGVAQALIKTEIQGLDLLTNEGNEALASPTFAALVAAIHDTLVEEIDVRENNEISFAAKDDMWGVEWRARTGFPLTAYQQKWDNLRMTGKGGSSTNLGHHGSVRFSDSLILSTSEANHRLKRLAVEYLNSNPGEDCVAKNHRVHGDCRKILQGKHLPALELEDLAGALGYRMISIMNQATRYKNRLGIEFLACSACDTDKHKARIIKAEGKSRYSKIYHMVVSKSLFDIPGSHEGWPYAKGYNYLAIVLTTSGWTTERIEEELIELERLHCKLVLRYSATFT